MPTSHAPASTCVIRTPRRGAKGYASQVWMNEGYWGLGVFPTTAAARKAALHADEWQAHEAINSLIASTFPKRSGPAHATRFPAPEPVADDEQTARAAVAC